MFAQLPEQLKQEVLQQLLKDNFQKAKAIHDAWLKANATDQQHSPSSANILASPSKTDNI